MKSGLDIVSNLCYNIIVSKDITTRSPTQRRGQHEGSEKSIEKPKRKSRTSATAVKKWQKNHVKRYGFPVMIDTEPEVIAKLESVSNKSGYIKGLIKADIAQKK